MISDQEFKEKLKAKIDELKEKTLSDLLNQDKEYLNSCEAHNLAEAEYLSLKLSKDQKEIIDKLLISTDTSNMEYSTLSYLAGIYDSPKYFNIFNFNENKEIEESSLIKDYYLGNFFPCEHDSESPSTSSFWKEIVNEESKFKLLLTESQLLAFNELYQKQMNGIGMSIEDSFVYGFQLGGKFMIEILK